MLILPGTQLDRYVIQGILGEGAMAVVYQAEHAELGSLHAIKRLKLPSQQVRDRLIQEGRLQSSLHHPNVLSVTDLLSVDGAPALVMEFIAGPNLSDLMSHQSLTLHQSDALARDLLKGVAAAHAHGLVHRDLKPANVLISVTEDALIPKVADFGLAKIMEGNEDHGPMTRTGASMGTPAYMAPEQIRDSSAVDARADVFSLGAILYELVTGKNCFVGNSIMEIWEQICAGNYRPVTQYMPDIPSRMARAIEGALIVDRNQRIETVADLFECWCSNDEGQHVEVPGRQSLNFWPAELRTDASDMAPTLERTGPQEGLQREGDSSTLVFVADKTTDMMPTGSTSESTLALPGSPPPPSPPSKPPMATILIVLVLLIGLALGWKELSESTSTTVAPAPEVSETVHPLEVSDREAVSTKTTDESKSNALQEANPRLFRLANSATETETQSMASTRHALLSGDIVRAERHLRALSEGLPEDPAVHSLQAITHYFRGRLSLSASAARKAAHLTRDQDTAAARLFKLSDRSWRETDNLEGLEPQWQALRSDHREPLVELKYLVSSQMLYDTGDSLKQIRTIRERYPEWAIWTVLELEILKAAGLHEEMRDAAEVGLERFPAVTTLRLGLASALILLDLGDEAHPHLLRVLQEDGSLTEARALLAWIYLIRGDEEARMTEFSMALSDTTSLRDQVQFLEDHGHHLAAHGRLSDATKVWNFCIQIAQDAGNFNNALTCSVADLGASIWLRPTEEWAARQDRVRMAVAHPSVDADLQQYYSIYLLMTEAFLAAREGDLERAKAYLGQVQAIKDSRNPLDSRRLFTREIRREIAIAQRNPTQLREQLSQLPSAKPSGLPRECTSFYNEVRLRMALDEKTVAMALSEKVLSGECRNSPMQEWIEALLRGELAKHKARKGDLKSARQLVEEFDHDWARPDAELPVVQTIEAVREKL